MIAISLGRRKYLGKSAPPEYSIKVNDEAFLTNLFAGAACLYILRQE